MRTYGKLREEIKRKYGTLSNFAAAIGIKRCSLSHKLNSLAPWKAQEIETICKELNIPIEQVSEYFFY